MMTDATTTHEPATSAERLTRRLSLLTTRRRWYARLLWLMMSLSAFVTLLVVTLLLDAAWHLPAWVRVLLVCGLMAIIAAGFVGMALIRTKADASSLLRDAMSVESHHDLRDNPVVNALQLAREHHASTGDAPSLTHQLRARVLERACETAQAADLRSVADRKALRRHGQILLMVLLVAGVLLAALPRLYAAGLARLTDPWGDHPPFSLTRFEIDAPIQAIARHEDVIVRVKLAGQLPETMQWAELDAQGQELARWPVERVGPGEYERRLRQVREDIRFRLVADTGYTRAIHLRVIDQPIEAAGDALTAQADPADEAAASTRPATTTQPESADLSNHPAMQALAQRHRELVETARAVQSSSESLSQALGSSSALLQQTADAADRFERQVREAAAAADAARQQAKGTPSGTLPDDQTALLDQALAGFDQLMKQLEIPRQPGPPSQGETQALAQWCESMGQAAAHDLARLMGQSQGSSSAMRAGRGQGDTGETMRQGDEPASTPETGGTRTGIVHETIPAASGRVDEHDARSRQVPPAYRTMVQQYFDRINQEEVGR